VRYARHDRPARDNFLGGDPHDVNMPLDYFIWAVVGAQRTFIVDMGFTLEQARKRKREDLRSPGEGLKRLGIEPEKLNDVSVGDMLEGHRKLRQLAASPVHIIPGHDPLVMTRYPAARADLQGIAVRLDAEPLIR